MVSKYGNIKPKIDIEPETKITTIRVSTSSQIILLGKEDQGSPTDERTDTFLEGDLGSKLDTRSRMKNKKEEDNVKPQSECFPQDLKHLKDIYFITS